MRSTIVHVLAVAVLGLAACPRGRGEDATNGESAVQVRLRESLAALDATRRRIADEKIPLNETLTKLEDEQLEARKAYESVKRQLDRRNLDMNNLRTEIKAREQEQSYLSNLLGEYTRNMENRLHICELELYKKAIERSRLATETADLPPTEIFVRQAGLVETSLQRLEDLLGGERFAGRAAGPDGFVKPGQFVLLGPVAYFATDDGAQAGIAEQRLGSVEPSLVSFADPACTEMTRDLVKNKQGKMPFDASLGNAHKVEETKQTLREHIAKGGSVMYPILGLAGAAALVIVFKWLALAFVRTPSRARFQRLLDAVAGGNVEAAGEAAAALPGPAGAMLRAGVEQLDAPKDLIEEIMFERMLDTRARLNRALPFIAVSAACAPLLGLLGTVTGIINTFKLITVFGSGDVKMLSSGISEALITTEFGLIIAIPTILAHAFLSRKAKATLDRMERLALTFLSVVEAARVKRAA